MWTFLFWVWVIITAALACGAFYEYISRYDLADRKGWAAMFFLSPLWPLGVVVFVGFTIYEMLTDLQKPEEPQRVERYNDIYYPY